MSTGANKPQGDATSSKFYENVLAERHAGFMRLADELRMALVQNNPKVKQERTRVFLGEANALAAVLSAKDRPPWLNNALGAGDEYLRRNNNPDGEVSGSSFDLLNALSKSQQEAAGHEWGSRAPTEGSAYDFDAVFEEARAESKLPELFDQMVIALQQIVSSGKVDSIKVTDALGRLTSTLQSAKSTSYFSTIMSIEFAQRFAKHAFWGYVKKIPGIETAVDAFDKALAEADVDSGKLKEQIASKLAQRFDGLLSNDAELDSLLLLPGPASDVPPSED